MKGRFPLLAALPALLVALALLTACGEQAAVVATPIPAAPTFTPAPLDTATTGPASPASAALAPATTAPAAPAATDTPAPFTAPATASPAPATASPRRPDASGTRDFALVARPPDSYIAAWCITDPCPNAVAAFNGDAPVIDRDQEVTYRPQTGGSFPAADLLKTYRATFLQAGWTLGPPEDTANGDNVVLLPPPALQDRIQSLAIYFWSSGEAAQGARDSCTVAIVRQADIGDPPDLSLFGPLGASGGPANARGAGAAGGTSGVTGTLAAGGNVPGAPLAPTAAATPPAATAASTATASALSTPETTDGTATMALNGMAAAPAATGTPAPPAAATSTPIEAALAATPAGSGSGAGGLVGDVDLYNRILAAMRAAHSYRTILSLPDGSSMTGVYVAPDRSARVMGRDGEGMSTIEIGSDSWTRVGAGPWRKTTLKQNIGELSGSQQGKYDAGVTVKAQPDTTLDGRTVGVLVKDSTTAKDPLIAKNGGKIILEYDKATYRLAAVSSGLTTEGLPAAVAATLLTRYTNYDDPANRVDPPR